MRIAIVGPTHPIKGGVSQHTTVLAKRLAAAGHDVEIVSWAHQYPERLYPGKQTVDAPESEPFQPTRHLLSWNRPDSWLRAARELRSFDFVVFAHITPVQVPAYRAMISVLHRSQTPIAVICHNVLPHERRATDKALVTSLIKHVDLVLVHSEAEAITARSLTHSRVAVAPMGAHQPDAFGQHTPAEGEHRRLLFFGLVRPYKGLDVLLRALSRAPRDVQLRVAGEFWTDVAQYRALAREVGVEDRVEFLPGYLAADEVAKVFNDVDALVLPYRSATGSQVVDTGFQFGVPVIATRTGALADDITDGVDGIVAEPEDVDSLAAALNRFYTVGTPLRMRAAVKPIDNEPVWQHYVDTLLSAAPGALIASPPGGKALYVAKRGAEELLWGRVAVQRRARALRGTPRPLPAPVPPTDVLSTDEQAARAVSECRRLGLPLHHDRPKNWDALGAVSTVLHELGSDIRVVDAGAARYSSVLPWLRLYNVRELVGNNLEFNRATFHGGVRFEPGDITATTYPDAYFDAITCISVIEHGVPLEGFAAESARLLRPGGLLIVSTDYDQEPPDTTGKTAYGTQVKIFGPDDIRAFVDTAARYGLRLMGELDLAHAQRPVHWDRTGLDYTFIRLAFAKS